MLIIGVPTSQWTILTSKTINSRWIQLFDRQLNKEDIRIYNTSLLLIIWLEVIGREGNILGSLSGFVQDYEYLVTRALDHI